MYVFRFSNKITFSAKRSTENSMLVEKIKEFTTSEEGKNAVNNLIIGYHLMWDVESAECRGKFFKSRNLYLYFI